MVGKWLLVASVLFAGVITAEQQYSLRWNDEDNRSLRLVEAPVTPNRIVDVMVNILVDFFARKGWNVNKPLATVSGSVPFATDSGTKAMQVEISNGLYKNMGSVRRAKSATLDTTRHLLRGALSFKGLAFAGNYKISTPAVGQAPASTASGSVSTTALKYFVDFSFITNTQGLPIGIQSWRSTAGKMQYNGASDLGSNQYKDVFDSVLKDSTRSLLDRLITNDLFNIVNNQIVNKMIIQ